MLIIRYLVSQHVWPYPKPKMFKKGQIKSGTALTVRAHLYVHFQLQTKYMIKREAFSVAWVSEDWIDVRMKNCISKKKKKNRMNVFMKFFFLSATVRNNLPTFHSLAYHQAGAANEQKATGIAFSKFIVTNTTNTIKARSLQWINPKQKLLASKQTWNNANVTKVFH